MRGRDLSVDSGLSAHCQGGSCTAVPFQPCSPQIPAHQTLLLMPFTLRADLQRVKLPFKNSLTWVDSVFLFTRRIFLFCTDKLLGTACDLGFAPHGSHTGFALLFWNRAAESGSEPGQSGTLPGLL